MLFDQEAIRLQEEFTRLEWLKFSGLNAGIASFNTNAGILQVSAPGPGILRLRLLPGLPNNQADYGLLVNPDALDCAASQAALSVEERTTGAGGTIRLRVGPPGAPGALELIFEQAPLRLAVFHQGKLLLESSTDRTIRGDLRLAPLAAGPQKWLLAFALPSGESVFGLGDKFGGLNKRGQLIENWNRDATGVNAEISYKNVPFAWSPQGWGLFIHTPSRVTHGVGYSPWSHRSYVIKVDDAVLDLFILCASTPVEMLNLYTALTGRTALPPRWSYGMWMSRALYQTAGELMEVADQLRERRIPCDVLTLDGRA